MKLINISPASPTEHYLLNNPDEKYDVIPEIWEGRNIADFIDPDIMEVRCTSCTICGKL